MMPMGRTVGSDTIMDDDGPRFDDLRALFVNCTLKRSPELK